MRITASYDSCSDGTCPAVHDTDDPELLAIQGPRLTDSEALADLGKVPAHEGVVVVPRSLLASYFGKQP
jgi:hypothetical protein